jgi:hypothetical protein
MWARFEHLDVLQNRESHALKNELTMVIFRVERQVGGQWKIPLYF